MIKEIKETLKVLEEPIREYNLTVENAVQK